jgi:hypothetical protein
MSPELVAHAIALPGDSLQYRLLKRKERRQNQHFRSTARLSVPVGRFELTLQFIMII